MQRLNLSHATILYLDLGYDSCQVFFCFSFISGQKKIRDQAYLKNKGTTSLQADPKGGGEAKTVKREERVSSQQWNAGELGVQMRNGK
mmetsp:Transcript_35421/g.92201  ORF Transcript_35421/g.92201 Transcript_35421/m.92201 type:complete len:88 (+) Transcript_35421:598-861(+)